MKMLYEARLSDLGPNDFVKVECTGCRHNVLIPASGFLVGLRLPRFTPILDLEHTAVP